MPPLTHFLPRKLEKRPALFPSGARGLSLVLKVFPGGFHVSPWQDPVDIFLLRRTGPGILAAPPEFGVTVPQAPPGL